MKGFSGFSARARWSAMSWSLIMARMISSASSSTLATSWEVRKPSKKCRNGTRDFSVAACAISAVSMTSCTLLEASIAQPIWRQAITSWWSPKIERAEAARERAETWKTVEVSSPAILYMLGIISRRPCEAVKVVVSAPDCRAPCTAPAAPPSDCISTTVGTVPQRFLRPSDIHWSAHSPMLDDGVMG